MLDFKRVSSKYKAKLKKVYSRANYCISDYSLGYKLMWKDYFKSEFAFFAGCMIIKNNPQKETYFEYPIPVEENADVDAALCEIEKYCSFNMLPLRFTGITRDMLNVLSLRYHSVKSVNYRLINEYFYNAQDLIEFKGRKYSGQRNHINKFKGLYPAARFVTEADKEAIEEFWQEFEKNFSKETKLAKRELVKAKEIISQNILTQKGFIELDGKIIALSQGEICGDTLVIHVEKALSQYQGVYPFMVQSFAECYAKNVKYINREEDCGDKGLRTSKTQYHPIDLLPKYEVYVENELASIKEIPCVDSEDINLTPIKEKDIDLYNVLCMDDERNKYWGYDYKEFLKGELYREYFYDDVVRGFEKRQTLNFAIRKNGRFVGETVLYNLDFKGEVEIGVRILKKYDRNGYGKKAFKMTCDWALYTLGVRRVVAKCFKENLPSFKMLSSCMDRAGEDEIFYYFKRTV